MTKTRTLIRRPDIGKIAEIAAQIAEGRGDDEACQIVADALNTAADQSRVIEVMRTALEKAQQHLKTHQHPFETDEYQYAVDMYNEIGTALAEAQRIMEGE